MFFMYSNLHNHADTIKRIYYSNHEGVDSEA